MLVRCNAQTFELTKRIGNPIGMSDMTTHTSSRITDAHRQQYKDEGFFILDTIIPEPDLAMLRNMSDRFVREQDQDMDRLGVDELNLNRRGSRYFVFLAYKNHPELAEFIFSDIMADICRSTVGDNAWLFWEQFVIKGTSNQSKSTFSWHQDAGYVDNVPVPRYVNAWIALDDVSEENGTVYLLPYSKAGTRERVEHTFDAATGDRIGYFGEELGVPVVAPAGSIAVFSSTTFHRSGPNTTSQLRRAYALQYSEAVVYEKDGSLKGLDEQFVRDGQRVR